jgi:hypothetical protein
MLRAFLSSGGTILYVQQLVAASKILLAASRHKSIVAIQWLYYCTKDGETLD